MATIAELVQELDQEALATRRTLARIPEDRLAWRPHEKSMTLGQLATHVATLPTVVVELAARPAFDVGTPSAQIRASRPEAGSVADLLAMHDRSVAEATAALSAMDDGVLAVPWRMVRGDREVGAIPIGALLRTSLFSHWAHHRGQLTVYLRLTGALVPALYGDSADEPAVPA